MSDTLARILADKRTEVERRKQAAPLAELIAQANNVEAPRGFHAALARAQQAGYGLIAEIKKASPSKGLIRTDFDPVALAQAYERGGATCLSVLTDEPWFQGHDSYLTAARAAVALPVLRKDFMIDAYQITEARALGADCILLIIAALDDGLAAELEQAAFDLGMDVLAEVHDRAELDRALAVLTTPLLGINNRNLKTLEVDTATTVELAGVVPDDRIVISESGLYSRADLDRMAKAGARSFLVGEALMRQDDVEQAVRDLLAP
jgi:indole-3-glycerol phosphate synthase